MRHLAALVLAAYLSASQAQEIRPGVWASITPDALPLPVRGYQIYLVGEMHGLQENAAFALQYLTLLHRNSGLRDVAIEEDAVYEKQAEAFVEGRSEVLPGPLCLRADVLEGIRKLNASLAEDSRIRIHLTDIDSPASAIREHLLALQKRLGAAGIRVPNQSAIRQNGLRIARELKALAADPATVSELRTIELSIRALQDGLEVDIGPSKGSPYLESREEAVTENIQDLIRQGQIPSLLVLYGSDHVSRTPRSDGGPKRNQPFTPMGLRLKNSGIKAFSLVTFPLAGSSYWRGHENSLLWSAADGHLSSGETLDRVLSASPGAQFLSIDTAQEHARLPSQDISRMEVDAFLLFRLGNRMRDECRAR